MLDDHTYFSILRHDVKFSRRTAAHRRRREIHLRIHLDPRTLSPKRGLLKPLEASNRSALISCDFTCARRMRLSSSNSRMGIVPAGSVAEAAFELSTARRAPDRFVCKRWSPGEKVTLQRNPYYWDERPAFARRGFQDRARRAWCACSNLKKATSTSCRTISSPTCFPGLKTIPMPRRRHLRRHDVSVHRHQSHPSDLKTTVKSASALAYAIDRDSIIRHLLKDIGTVPVAFFRRLIGLTTTTRRAGPTTQTAPSNCSMKPAFLIPTATGPLPRFRLSFKTTNIDLRRRIAEAIKEQLQQVGIELEMRSYEWGTFYSDVKKGNFHLYSLAWVGMMDPDILLSDFSLLERAAQRRQSRPLSSMPKSTACSSAVARRSIRPSDKRFTAKSSVCSPTICLMCRSGGGRT